MTLGLNDTIAAMAQQGDAWARWQLLEMHQRMIGQFASKASLAATNLTPEDARQNAVVAVLEMLDLWKPNAGCSFATYCFNWVPMRLRRHHDMTGFIVKIPAAAGVKQRKSGEQMLPFTASIYAPSLEGEDGGEEILRHEVEATAVQYDPIKVDLEAKLQGLIHKLPQRQREVVQATLYETETREDIASRWGVTHQAVSAAYKAGIKRLRDMAHALA